MAKKQTTKNEKKPSRHGKVHAMNMGSVGKATELSEGGRKRKKAINQARNQAHERELQAQKTLEDVRLEKTYSSLSKNYGALCSGREGTYGLRVIKHLNDRSLFGTLRLEIEKRGKNDLPSVVVSGSTFDPIPASEKNYIPVQTLFHANLKDIGLGQDIYAWQSELHKVLRHYLAKEIQIEQANFKHSKEVSRQVIAPQLAVRKPVKVPAPAPAHEIGEEDEVDVTGHKPFTPAEFLGKPDSGIFTHEEDGKLAFFRLERIAGVRAFRLVAVDDGHSLESVLSRHDSMHVHVQDLSANDRPYGDIADKRNARECVRQYLRKVGMSLGVKPKMPRQETPQTASAV